MSAPMKSALAIAAILLAGCVTPPPPTPIPGAKTIDLAKPFDLAINATGCLEGDLLLFVPKDTLQKQLPPGFEAADAQTVGGAPPVPMGAGPRGLALANAFVCQGSTLGAGALLESQFTILIDKPNVKGDRPASAIDFYEVARILPEVNERAPYLALGWDAFAGNVSLDANGQSANGKVQQMGNDSFSFSVTTPAGPAAGGIGRFWHAVPTGVAWTDYTFAASTQQMGGAQCAIAAGSILAKMTGLTGCGPGDAAGISFTRSDAQIGLHYLPNVTAS